MIFPEDREAQAKGLRLQANLNLPASRFKGAFAPEARGVDVCLRL